MFHIRNIGKMIEEAESVLRSTICDDSFNKQRQIINSGRLVEEYLSGDQKTKF